MKKVKALTKVEAFNKSAEDFKFAMTHVEALATAIMVIGSVSITDNLTIDKHSSDKQYIFAISVLNNQILAAKELGINYDDLVQKKENALTVRSLKTEMKEWQTYAVELKHYHSEVGQLLSDDERFSLLEYPKK